MTDELKPINLNTEETAEPTGKTAEPMDKTLKPMNKLGGGTNGKKKMISILLMLVVLGIGSGYGLFKLNQPKAPEKLKSTNGGEINKGDKFGVMDEKAFRDEVEGDLVSGGIDGEGSHHLEREGGESQYVYLTSSIIDLDKFVDMKVKVWGETFEGQKAGWLMDVGRLEVL